MLFLAWIQISIRCKFVFLASYLLTNKFPKDSFWLFQYSHETSLITKWIYIQSGIWSSAVAADFWGGWDKTTQTKIIWIKQCFFLFPALLNISLIILLRKMGSPAWNLAHGSFGFPYTVPSIVKEYLKFQQIFIKCNFSIIRSL